MNLRLKLSNTVEEYVSHLPFLLSDEEMTDIRYLVLYEYLRKTSVAKKIVVLDQVIAEKKKALPLIRPEIVAKGLPESYIDATEAYCLRKIDILQSIRDDYDIV
jgi:hypothetical protein